MRPRKYLFQDPDGEFRWHDYPAAAVPSCGAGAWPYASDAMGVHPDQIAEQEAAYAEQGIKARHTRDGRVIVESRQHRRQLLKANGLIDRSGGYGETYNSNT